nr:integrase, catalytic region, zinc finger, CCHC-type, peptidase aspartic, catalytic [Tanacetum cinerariifolium]
MRNDIMAASSKDCRLMLATERYAQWQSRFMRYDDTKPNMKELKKCIFNGPYQGESLNKQDVKTNLFWEFGKFTSRDGESIESYYSRFYKMMNEMYPDDNYYHAPKPHKNQTISSRHTSSTNYHAPTKTKGKEVAKLGTPPSLSASEEDSDPEQAQRDKDMQKMHETKTGKRLFLPQGKYDVVQAGRESELKKLIEKSKEKSMENNFDKPPVVPQTNAIKVPKPSVLGKPTDFSDSLEKRDFSKPRSDLYTIALQESSLPTPICLLAKASPTQAWLWHHRLSHLNFDTINLLSKNDIVKGLPNLKFVKDQLCSSCEMCNVTPPFYSISAEGSFGVLRINTITSA